MFSYEPLANTLKDRKMSIADLADVTGLRCSMLVSRMNGGEYLSVSQLDKICTALKVPIENVIKWKDGEQNSAERVNVNWQKIYELSSKNNLSINELSKRCRLNSSTLCKTKMRNGSITKQTALLIAKNLNCNLEDII